MITVLVLISTLSLVGLYFSKWLFPVCLVLMIALSFLQFQYTSPTDYLHQNEIEISDRLKRMNEYPPYAARLSNWIEARKESVAFFKLEKNFIGIFDLTYFFGGLYKPLLFPLFIYGYFEFLKHRKKEILTLSLIPVIVIVLIGPESTKGLFNLYPIIYSSAALAMLLIFKNIYFHEK